MGENQEISLPTNHGVSGRYPHVIEHPSPFASEHHAPSVVEHHASSLEKSVSICPGDDQLHQGSFQLSIWWDLNQNDIVISVAMY